MRASSSEPRFTVRGDSLSLYLARFNSLGCDTGSKGEERPQGSKCAHLVYRASHLEAAGASCERADGAVTSWIIQAMIEDQTQVALFISLKILQVKAVLGLQCLHL